MNQIRSVNPTNIARVLCTTVPLMLMLMMVGCVAPATHQGMPDDFSLDVAILPEAGSPNANAAQHFILHADGTLRAGRGPQGALDRYPGQARKLSSVQMAELLTITRQAMAVASQKGSTAPTQWLHEPPATHGGAMLLWVRDSGQESAARFDSTDGTLPPVAENLRHRLQQLALMR